MVQRRENEDECEEKNEKKHALIAGGRLFPKQIPYHRFPPRSAGMFTGTRIYSSAYPGVEVSDQVRSAENKN